MFEHDKAERRAHMEGGGGGGAKTRGKTGGSQVNERGES